MTKHVTTALLLIFSIPLSASAQASETQDNSKASYLKYKVLEGDCLENILHGIHKRAYGPEGFLGKTVEINKTVLPKGADTKIAVGSVLYLPVNELPKSSRYVVKGEYVVIDPQYRLKLLKGMKANNSKNSATNSDNKEQEVQDTTPTPSVAPNVEVTPTPQPTALRKIDEEEDLFPTIRPEALKGKPADEAPTPNPEMMDQFLHKLGTQEPAD